MVDTLWELGSVLCFLGLQPLTHEERKQQSRMQAQNQSKHVCHPQF